MIPRVGGHSNRFAIHGSGQSFKGAGLYYLHDKNKASTANRVAFTRTINLPTEDPDKALRLMAYTAMRAGELKAQAGGAKTGRKLQKTVYTYSLSWHPEEKVTPAEMIEAARETMKILKIDDREALLVAHNDEAYPHIHVIVNRVSPENGLRRRSLMTGTNSRDGRSATSSSGAKSTAISALPTTTGAPRVSTSNTARKSTP